jgi:hypothetical protein
MNYIQFINQLNAHNYSHINITYVLPEDGVLNAETCRNDIYNIYT